jgi:hypothetical protein
MIVLSEDDMISSMNLGLLAPFLQRGEKKIKAGMFSLQCIQSPCKNGTRSPKFILPYYDNRIFRTYSRWNYDDNNNYYIVIMHTLIFISNVYSAHKI